MPGSPPPGAKSLDNPGASSRSASPQAAGGSPMAPVSERDRMLSAVQRMGVPKAESIVGLLMTLSKKERALCLFNADVLRGKVHDAQSVIEASEGDETALVSKLENVSLEQNQLPTPQPTPERRSQKGSMGPSVSPALVSEITTAAGLAKLPAVKIIELAHSENPPPAIAIPSTETSQEIDTFVDGLLTKSVNEQKQKLGERLFKRIKELGVVKGAPKLTIHLLDTEDLRALGEVASRFDHVGADCVS